MQIKFFSSRASKRSERQRELNLEQESIRFVCWMLFCLLVVISMFVSGEFCWFVCLSVCSGFVVSIERRRAEVRVSQSFVFSQRQVKILI